MPDGSFTVIVGPNACGKSTLLRTLSRLLAPNAGEVVLDGISNGFIDPSLASNWAGLGSHLGRRGRQREIHLEYTAASNSVSR
ncbi:ATP-binding cassette domain-containing protein [Gordonia sp. ABSL49_1]|uniref:ATP-binding cassette domain-containing protein n=1 Tax=Gordonia sp. ABSL49_1 TaxID=2920941 RepID=UPI0035B0AC99